MSVALYCQRSEQASLCSLKGYFGIMDKAAQTLVAELKEAAAESRTVDMHRVLGDMTLEAVAAAAFGCAPIISDSLESVEHSRGIADAWDCKSKPVRAFSPRLHLSVACHLAE